MDVVRRSGRNKRQVKRLISVVLSGVALLCLAACHSAAGEADTPSIAVTILPQKEIVHQIVGNRFHVEVLIPPGFNPATFAPAPSRIRRLGRSLAWFRIGKLPVERTWTDRIRSVYPNLEIVDTSRGVEWIVPQGHDHRHSNGVDPHIWLSPRLMLIQAENIMNAMVRLDPEHGEEYRRNYRQLARKIKALDKQIHDMLADLPRRSFMVFHPSWAYFACDYALEQVVIEAEGKSPAPGDLSRIIALARREGLRTVFVQPQFDTAAAKVVAREINGRVVILDPLAEDWAENLISTARKLRTAQEVSLR
ncbi:MAG TPA: ABC transporter substrate-binding protein [Candidatus Aminicenantes bacterium]|nr:ABC transporter substrate-binding protein [Candidatus Aminicenantes bacterium]